MPPVHFRMPPLNRKRPREESPEPSPVSKIALLSIAAAGAAVPDPNTPLSNDGWDEEEVEPLTQAEVQELFQDKSYQSNELSIPFLTKEKAKAFVKYIEQNNAIHDIATYTEDDAEGERFWHKVCITLRPVAEQQGTKMWEVVELLKEPDLLSRRAAAAGQFSFHLRSLESDFVALKLDD